MFLVSLRSFCRNVYLFLVEFLTHLFSVHNPESTKSKPIWIVAILIGVILLLLLVVAIVLIRLGAVFIVSHYLSNRRHFIYVYRRTKPAWDIKENTIKRAKIIFVRPVTSLISSSPNIWYGFPTPPSPYEIRSIGFIKLLRAGTTSSSRKLKRGFNSVIKVCLRFTFIIRSVIANDTSMSLPAR